MDFESVWNNWHDAGEYSGVFSIRDENGAVFEKCCGYRNRGESLPNNSDTAFGIASGTKLFTGLSVCTMLDGEKLLLHDRLCDVLPYKLGRISRKVTIHQLLTHTSGVGDYIDEEAEGSYEQMEDLYCNYPVYLWEDLEYYLPMITKLKPKFKPGERYGYSNAGYVLLGLVVEAVSGIAFQDYVRERIIEPCKLLHTGFYRMDSLPANTALGYFDDEDGECRTNVFHLPIIGGSDGGLYSCAGDLDTLWRSLFSGRLLSDGMLEEFLKPQVMIAGAESYGLGLYRNENAGKPVYYAVGGDFGVDFFTAYSPEHRITLSALANTETNTFPLFEAALEAMIAQSGSC